MHTVEISTSSGTIQKFTLETPNDFNVIAASCNSNVCFFCDKTFTNVYNCRRHIRTHSGEKPFECKVCGKKFSRQSTLNAHEKVHTGNQLFKCETCGQAFDVYRQLTEHQLVHRIDKPFTCKICNKSYSRATVLSQHMKSHTAGQTAGSVAGAQLTFETVSMVQPETMSVTSIPMLEEPVSVGGSGGATTTVTVPIISQALYKCQQCEQMFITPSELKNHELVHIAAAKEDKQKAANIKEVVVVMQPEEPQVIQILPHINFVTDATDCVEPIVGNMNAAIKTDTLCSKPIVIGQSIGSCGVNNSISIINNTNGATIGASNNNNNTILNSMSTSSGSNSGNVDFTKIVNSSNSNVDLTKFINSTSTTVNNNVNLNTTTATDFPKIANTNANNNNNFVANTVYNNNMNRSILGNPTQTIVPITPLTITHPIKVVVIESPALPPIYNIEELNDDFNYEDPITAQDDDSILLESKTCTQCSRKFRSDVDLQNHMKMHVSPNERYKCDICDRRFTVLSNYNAHKRFHEREKPFRCTVCGKNFRLQKSLNAHMLLHTESSFSCPICDKTFKRNVNLKVHMKSHTPAERRQPQRTYIDAMCFDDADDLFAEIHGNNNDDLFDFLEDISPYTFCDICGEKYMRTHPTIRTHECIKYGEDDMDDEDGQLIASPEVWACE